MEDCTRAQELLEAELLGLEIDAEDRLFLAKHAALCPGCALEVEALGSLDLSAPDGPPPFSDDDLYRRKWIDDTLAKARAVEASRGRGPGVLRRFVPAVAAAAVVAAVGGAAAFFVATRPADPPREHAAPVAVAAAEQPKARAPAAKVLLRSGRDRLASASLANGAALMRGDTVALDGGSAVLEISEGTRVLVEGGTKLEIEQLGEEAVVLTLRSGRLLAMVDPALEAAALSVRTAFGVVEVAGTVFAVDADDPGVSVLRGKVTLDRGDGRVTTIGVQERWTARAEAIEPSTDDDLRMATDALRLFDLLGGPQGSTLEISSLPDGADVTLDAVPLGTTPLFATIRPGHRVIELALDDQVEVRELLELGRGARVSRTFDLEADDGSADRTGSGRGVKATARASASDLMEKAQRLRRERDWRGAARVYEEIARFHPTSDEARIALVSLGELRIDHLADANGALRSFDAYLARAANGALAQEAGYGRIRALRALGRTQAEREAMERFLARYPGAVQAQMIRDRLEEIR